jgi:hypothetical protein
MTSVVPVVDPAALEGEAAQLFSTQMDKHGRVTNMVRTLLHSMPSFRALEFYPVRDELTAIIGSRAVYFFCYAISMEDDCIICSRYHARLLNEIGVSFAEFEFTDVENVLVEYGRALVRNPGSIDERIYEGLRTHFSSDQIVLITAVGVKMIASNLFNVAMKIELDDYLFDVEFDDKLMGRAHIS